MQRIAVIGAGAWGTALALAARRTGREVAIWAREATVVESINTQHLNPLFLPGVDLDPGIEATGTLALAVAGADAILLVTPAQHLRAMTAELAPHLPAGAPAVICAKGIEAGTGALMTEVAAETMPKVPVAVLSGPSFAAEVARAKPTAVTLACADQDLGAHLADALGTPYFRLYLSDDPLGAQFGGAVKNVIAIACGVAMGREMGDNARAALLTRGAGEITRLALAMGARAETMMGLSGLGDLALTCCGPQSRNFTLGVELGQGRTLADIMAERRSVAEGVHTAASVLALARRHGVEMPISAAVDAVVNHGADLDETIRALLARPTDIEAPWARD